MNKAILVVCIALCCVAVRGNAAITDHYGPVQASDNLYRIALKYRQEGATVSQLMMSIFAANPDAFARDNINRLKQDAMLDIPDHDTITSLDPGQAYNDATAHIETYEREIRQQQASSGELTTLSQASNDPGATTGAALAVTVNEPDQEQIEEIKQGMAADEVQVAQQMVLPEPKAAKRKKKAKKPEKPLFRYSYDISLIDDDNVRLAQNEEDIRSDLILSTKVSARGGKALDDFSLLNYGGSATYNKFDTFDTLDNFDFEVNTRYRFALSSGFT